MTDDTNPRTASELLASIESAAKIAAQENSEQREQMKTDRLATNKLLSETDAALNDALAVFEEAEPQVITEDDIQNTPAS